jgi:hypothetical protein
MSSLNSNSIRNPKFLPWKVQRAPLSLPPSAVATQHVSGDTLNWIERAYDKVGLMRGPEYLPVARGLVTMAAVTMALYVWQPEPLFDQNGNLKTLALAIPFGAFAFGAFFV